MRYGDIVHPFGDVQQQPRKGVIDQPPFVGEIPQPFGNIEMPPCWGYIDQTGFI